MSVMLPQYPTYFDTDTPQKQIEVVRSYLGELKTALESNMSSVKMSDLDQDVQDLFVDLQNGITLSDEELAKAETDITNLFALVEQVAKDLIGWIGQMETEWHTRAFIANRIDTEYKDDACKGQINAVGDITTGGDFHADGKIEANGNIVTDGVIKTSDQLQVDGMAFLHSDALIEGQLQVGSSQTSANTFLHGQLSVDGNTFIEGQLQVEDKTFLYDNLNVQAVSSGGTVSGGRIQTQGGDIQATAGTFSGTTYGGKVYAEIGYQTPTSYPDKYYHEMTTTINGETVHFLGYKDSDFPAQS